MNFNSHTDVVVRVAVDLVNLLTPGEERGRRYTPPEADERTAAVWDGSGWRAAGAGTVTVRGQGRTEVFPAGAACRGIPAPVA